MDFEINGTKYIVQKHEAYYLDKPPSFPGWYWSTALDESPLFTTALEAQQSALNTEYEKYHGVIQEFERRPQPSWYGEIL